jgi:small subunit ribosomal protein S9
MATETTTYIGTGRRKTATARIRMTDGTGKIMVNGKEADQYFVHESYLRSAIRPLVMTELQEKLDVRVTVSGGGDHGQAGAVSHGIARALLKYNIELRGDLKSAGLLTRDPRGKERKKAGQPGARKRFQFSKR